MQPNSVKTFKPIAPSPLTLPSSPSSSSALLLLKFPSGETVKLSNLPLAPPPPQHMQPPIHVETKTRLVALFAKRKHDFDNFYPAGWSRPWMLQKLKHDRAARFNFQMMSYKVEKSLALVKKGKGEGGRKWTKKVREKSKRREIGCLHNGVGIGRGLKATVLDRKAIRSAWHVPQY